MEEAMVIRKGGTGKRLGLLAVLMAAVFLVFMGAHTVYGAGGLDLNTDYPGISVDVYKRQSQLCSPDGSVQGPCKINIVGNPVFIIIR